jgi:hypothetical protein
MRYQTFKMLAGWSLVATACATPALADSVITPITISNSSVSMLALEEELFGLDPSDSYSQAAANQLWTSDANAALYANMLLLITTLGGDQSMISQLFQPGAIFAGQTNPYAAVSQPQIALQTSGAQGAAPEPGTMGLLGGALLFLCCYAFYRQAKPAKWADTTNSSTRKQ